MIFRSRQNIYEVSCNKALRLLFNILWNVLQITQELYKLGARRISVFSTVPLGCLPILRTIGGGILRKCALLGNLAAQSFNSKLSAEVDYLASKLPTTQLVYIDIYKPLLYIIQNAYKYGSLSLSGCIFFFEFCCALYLKDICFI